MTFDLTQTPPKPATLVECHELISRLWTYAQSIKEKLNCNSTNSSLSPSSERFKKSTTKADNKDSWEKRTLAYWKKRKPGAKKGHVGVGRKLWHCCKKLKIYKMSGFKNRVKIFKVIKSISYKITLFYKMHKLHRI